MRVVVGAGIAAAALALLRPKEDALPSGIAMSNGRLEATEIDVATKLAGRLNQVLVQEGDFVEQDQLLATIDTSTLAAQLLEAEAQVRRARHAVVTAKSLVSMRESELALAKRDLERTEALAAKGQGFVAEQKIDADRTHVQTTKAALDTASSLVVESEAGLEAAQATVSRVRADIEDCNLRAPRRGRVQYRLAEPGEVLAPGGKVVTLLDLEDVYMTVFLPEGVAGRLPIGSEARIVLDAVPRYAIPGRVSFVSEEAQFTPKVVETAVERQKLAFRVKVHIPKELLRRYPAYTKVGLPGVVYVKTTSRADWPPGAEVPP